jgi:hypothetical protein
MLIYAMTGIWMGLNTSFTYNFNRFLGATGEIGGNYCNASASGVKADQFFFLFEPEFAYWGQR